MKREERRERDSIDITVAAAVTPNLTPLAAMPTPTVQLFLLQVLCSDVESE